MVAGRYFDGASSRAYAVQLFHDAGALRIVGEDVERSVPSSRLVFTPSHAPAPILVSIPDGGICELPDTPESRALLALLGASPSQQNWLRVHRKAVWALTLGFICLMAAVWRWGIPLAADLIVDRVPASWDERVGDAVLGQLEANGVFKPSTLPVARQAGLEHRFEVLAKPQGAPRYRLAFRQMGTPNAFALPGGAIVVADELVALAPPDDAALLTVLGHELGHLHYRHGMRAVVRATLFTAVSAWYLGDVSSVAAGAAAGFTALSYSRDAERAADRYALDFMHADGISTLPAVELFQRLMDWQPAKGSGSSAAPSGHLQVPEYLSTHPDMRERMRLFGQGTTTTPAAAPVTP